MPMGGERSISIVIGISKPKATEKLDKNKIECFLSWKQHQIQQGNWTEPQKYSNSFGFCFKSLFAFRVNWKTQRPLVLCNQLPIAIHYKDIEILSAN